MAKSNKPKDDKQKDDKKTFTEKVQDKSAKNAALRDFQNQEQNTQKEGFGPDTKR